MQDVIFIDRDRQGKIDVSRLLARINAVRLKTNELRTAMELLNANRLSTEQMVDRLGGVYRNDPFRVYVLACRFQAMFHALEDRRAKAWCLTGEGMDSHIVEPALVEVAAETPLQFVNDQFVFNLDNFFESLLENTQAVCN